VARYYLLLKETNVIKDYTGSVEAERESTSGRFAAEPDGEKADEKTSEIRSHVGGIGNNRKAAS